MSGEVTLHHDRVYIQVSQPATGHDSGILIRRCKGRKDYTGERNHFASLSLLDDLPALASARQRRSRLGGAAMTKPTPPRTPSALKLQITQAEWEQLYKNGLIQAKVKGTSKELDPVPVVKLFYPASAATWLLTEVEPDEPDIAWGLCDLGMGFPEFGTVSLQELAELKGFAGLRIERDRFFKAKAPISRYIEAARSAGQIVENLPDTALSKRL